MMFMTRAEISTTNRTKLNKFMYGARTQQYLAHQLIWDMFRDETERPFIFTATDKKQYLILSSVEPQKSDVLNFDTKQFEPAFRVGDQLQFKVNANATKRIYDDTGSKRIDLFTAAVLALGDDYDASQNHDIAQRVTRDWIESVGQNNGFGIVSVEDADYSTTNHPKNRRLRIGVAEESGVLTVTDADKFASVYANGIGREKAFGFGMLMLKRA